MGYRVPEAATVVVNNLALELDEETFKDPYDFKPE
jgi:cytochrome P450